MTPPESYKRFGIRKEAEVVKRKRDIGRNKYEKKTCSIVTTYTG